MGVRLRGAVAGLGIVAGLSVGSPAVAGSPDPIEVVEGQTVFVSGVFSDAVNLCDSDDVDVQISSFDEPDGFDPVLIERTLPRAGFEPNGAFQFSFVAPSTQGFESYRLAVLLTCMQGEGTLGIRVADYEVVRRPPTTSSTTSTSTTVVETTTTTEAIETTTTTEAVEATTTTATPTTAAATTMPPPPTATVAPMLPETGGTSVWTGVAALLAALVGGGLVLAARRSGPA